MKSPNKGISAIGIVIILALVSAISAGTYFYLNSIKSGSIANWKIYKNKDRGFSFDYPRNWKFNYTEQLDLYGVNSNDGKAFFSVKFMGGDYSAEASHKQREFTDKGFLSGMFHTENLEVATSEITVFNKPAIRVDVRNIYSSSRIPYGKYALVVASGESEGTIMEIKFSETPGGAYWANLEEIFNTFHQI
jgi:hypothetical protein